MNNPLITGLFGAWTMVQFAVGVFFLQAYWARRQEVEYLLFAFVCGALSVTDAGLTLSSAYPDLTHWFAEAAMIHVGATWATAFNMHFVLAFVARERMRRVSAAAYGLAVFYSALFLAGYWWEPGSTHRVHGEFLGVGVDQMLARPTPAGASGYVILLLTDLAALGMLALAYRDGKREVRGALIGLAILILSAACDVTNLVRQTGIPALFPYAFLLYGFGVADTLIGRYRHAAGELEATANELRQATEELTNSYLELSVVQEELFKRRQLASVGELAGSIAHEVRNPLAIIMNAAASLKRPALGPEDRNTLFGIIEEEITRLNNLVSELLRYARPMNVRREAVSIREVLKGLAEKVPPPHRLEVDVASDPEVETVWADPNLLRLALSNLVDNAVQAIPGEGTITVHATRDRAVRQPTVKIEISDTGHGMDSETRRRAMDPFFSTKPSGTGLGLPIAARIADAHGGSIEVQSREGDGTTVTLRIPAKTGDRQSEPRLSVEPRA